MYRPYHVCPRPDRKDTNMNIPQHCTVGERVDNEMPRHWCTVGERIDNGVPRHWCTVGERVDNELPRNWCTVGERVDNEMPRHWCTVGERVDNEVPRHWCTVGERVDNELPRNWCTVGERVDNANPRIYRATREKVNNAVPQPSPIVEEDVDLDVPSLSYESFTDGSVSARQFSVNINSINKISFNYGDHSLDNIQYDDPSPGTYTFDNTNPPPHEENNGFVQNPNNGLWVKGGWGKQPDHHNPGPINPEPAGPSGPVKNEQPVDEFYNYPQPPNQDENESKPPLGGQSTSTLWPIFPHPPPPPPSGIHSIPSWSKTPRDALPPQTTGPVEPPQQPTDPSRQGPFKMVPNSVWDVQR